MQTRGELFQNTLEYNNAHSNFPGAVFVEGWTSNLALQAKWEKYGVMIISPLYQSGFVKLPDQEVPFTYGVLDSQSKYGIAMQNISSAMSAGEIPDTSHFVAFDHMMNGTFDESEFARFLPRQTE